MAPALRDGDRLRVEPLRQTPRPGDVVVLERAGMLVAHRLVRLEGGVVTTRGDSLPYDDEPSSLDAVVGRVGQVRRSWWLRLRRRLALLAFGRS